MPVFEPLLKKTHELLAAFDSYIEESDNHDLAQEKGETFVYNHPLVYRENFETVGEPRESKQPPTDKQHTEDEACLDFMLALILMKPNRVTKANISLYTKQLLEAGPALAPAKPLTHEDALSDRPLEEVKEVPLQQRQEGYLANNLLGMYFAAYESIFHKYTLAPETRKLFKTKGQFTDEVMGCLDETLRQLGQQLKREIGKYDPELDKKLPKAPDPTKNYGMVLKAYNQMLSGLTERDPPLPKEVSDQFHQLGAEVEISHAQDSANDPLLIKSLNYTAQLVHGEITSEQYLKIAQKIKQDDKAAAKYKCHGKISALMIGLGLALIAAGILTFGVASAAGLGLVSIGTISTGAATAVGSTVLGADSYRLFKRAKATQAVKERLGEEMGKVAKHAPKPGGGSEEK